jgi:tight adherence protein B
MMQRDMLLAIAALLMIGLIVACAMVLVTDRRRRVLSARLATIAKGYGRTSAPATVSAPATPRRLVPRSTPVQRLLALIALDPQATMQHPAPWRAVLAVACALGGIIAWQGSRLFGLPGLLAGPAVGLLACRAAFAHGRARYRQRLHAQIPDVLAMVVRAVRAGIPVVEAVRAVAREVPSPTREEFSTLSAQVAVGMPLDAALWALVHRSGVPEYSFFAVALTLQAQTGGSLAETLDNLADIVRKRIAIRARGLALAAEARTSAAVLTGVPICTGIGLAVLNPDYMSIMFNDPRGHRLLAAAAGTLLLGTLSIRMLIKRTLA